MNHSWIIVTNSAPEWVSNNSDCSFWLQNTQLWAPKLTQEGHLLRDLDRLKVQQTCPTVGGVEGRQVKVRQQASPPVFVLEDELRPEGSGQAQLPGLHQAGDEGGQFLQESFIEEINVGQAVNYSD